MVDTTKMIIKKTSVLDDLKQTKTPTFKKKNRISPLDIPQYKDEMEEFENTNEGYLKDLNQKEKFMNQ